MVDSRQGMPLRDEPAHRLGVDLIATELRASSGKTAVSVRLQHPVDPSTPAWILWVIYEPGVSPPEVDPVSDWLRTLKYSTCEEATAAACVMARGLEDYRRTYDQAVGRLSERVAEAATAALKVTEALITRGQVSGDG